MKRWLLLKDTPTPLRVLVTILLHLEMVFIYYLILFCFKDLHSFIYLKFCFGEGMSPAQRPVYAPQNISYNPPPRNGIHKLTDYLLF